MRNALRTCFGLAGVLLFGSATLAQSAEEALRERNAERLKTIEQDVKKTTIPSPGVYRPSSYFETQDAAAQRALRSIDRAEESRTLRKIEELR